jgi:hypothetical protein
MQLEFWEWMIRGGENLPAQQEGILGQLGQMMRDGKLKARNGPWRARDVFHIPINREDGPIWTFDRMGATHTELPDGRVVCIGGEHEDDYDPDFFIYNDVIVIGPSDQIAIYGYPIEVFQQTDFHTATLVDGRIIIVGCFGYPVDCRPGSTPVYVLDLEGYRITAMETSGQMPGWIFRHTAEIDSAGIITIRRGQVHEMTGGQPRTRRNLEDFTLDIRSGIWRRLTNRNWRQYSICREDREWFELDQSPEGLTLLPRNIEHSIEPCEDDRSVRIRVGGVPVSLTVSIDSIEVIVEGELPGELALRVVEEIRTHAETAIQRRCVLEEV